ncbi:hypothetical protein [Rickettsiella endosymbiont of Dermanyssus gallinae]|nr:hypothetical protein [Rickettsiella endosymbiont of Dermanyssus gallinae]
MAEILREHSDSLVLFNRKHVICLSVIRPNIAFPFSKLSSVVIE